MTQDNVRATKNQTRVYLDHAATTPLGQTARAAMEPHFAGTFGNASSPYAVSRAARMAVDRARGEVAAFIGAQPDEIVFTSGGTESDNWALLGVALNNLDKRGQVIVSAIEHHAVLEPAQTLCDLGFDVDYLAVDANGVASPDELRRLLARGALLVSVMAVNNETGVCQNVREMAQAAREQGALLHCDAVQAAGKMPLDVNDLGVDLVSLSAHKFGGPKGVGALYIRRGTKMRPLLRGGAQERGRRAGTENVPAIAGMGAAAEAARRDLEANRAHLLRLRERLECGILALDGAIINAQNAPRAPHVTNFSLPGRRAESLALNLDMLGFAVGTGSACASGALEPSHVLSAMGRSQDEARASLRVSLGTENTAAEIDEFLAALAGLLQR